MQRNLWMRPALQKSEAVFLPALHRRAVAEPVFSDLYAHTPVLENPFRPVDMFEPKPTTALSTYVRPRGSFGGRSVLRAAGVAENPFYGQARPRYAQWNQTRRQPLARAWNAPAF